MIPLGAHEERTRVTCHLPLNNAAEEKAFKEIIAHLDRLRQENVGVDGYTYSDPSAFTGRWWNTGAEGWVPDMISLLMIDFKIDLADPAVSLAEKTGELKQTIRAAYAKYGRPQDEIWVIAHRVMRFL